MSLAEPKTSAVSPESPWLGLRPFTEGVREYFFGRDAEVRDLFQRVVHKPLTILFGRSGLGKTSLLQAALVPRLRDAGFLPIVLRLDYADGTAPLLGQFVDALIAALTPVLPGLDASLTRLSAEARLPWLLFHDPVFGLTAPEVPRPVVLLDQFEEIFTMGQATSERQAAAAEFLEMLADLVENRVPEGLRSLLETDDALADRLDYAARPAKILLSLREDFLHMLERYRGRMPALMDNRFELRLLTGPQALEAVVEPGRLRCRPGTQLAAIVSEATGGAIVRFVAGVAPDIPLAEIDAVPPLLSLLCAELNEQRLAAGESVIRPGQLEGRAEDILGQFYERCFAPQPAAVRTFVEARLLSADGFRESTTLDTATRELIRAGLTRAATMEAIAGLVNARLLASEERGGVRRIELTHDVLTGVARRSRDARVEHARRRRRTWLISSLVCAVILLGAFISAGFFYIDWRKKFGDWTEEFKVDFSEAPPGDPALAMWLKDNFTDQFIFENREATSRVAPWPVTEGAMAMRPQEWCWLKNVRIRDDTKVVVDLRFAGKPEAFQICINTKKKLRQWDYNPPGYSCRFGIWGGSMDSISRNGIDDKIDFNSFLVNSTLQTGSAGRRDFSLTFRRYGETVSLQVNGKDVHEDTYLIPLLGGQDAQGGRSGYYENIGIRTWGTHVDVLSLDAYRLKLPENASPTVAGDALVEAGDLDEAIEKYKTIAQDYNKNISISALALTKGYLLAVQRRDASRRKYFYGALAKPIQFDWLHPFQGAARAKYLDRIREVETLMLWNEGKYQGALENFSSIFKANPKTRIAVECLQLEHRPLAVEVSQELLRQIAVTFVHTPELAGLDISSFGMTDLGALAAVHSLRGLDCGGNQLSSLEPLRSMDKLRGLYCGGNQLSSLDPLRGMNNLTSLYCGQNQIGTLEPIRALKLIELYCDENQLESLEPLGSMPLLTLYCGRNRIKDLSPLKGRPIYSLNCAHNQISLLDPVAELPELGELYCGFNHIRSIEPLRRAKKLGYLDCSNNKIQSLEPLRDLELYSLDCSGNPIVTLEPFVDAKDPPKYFSFDECETLPEAEIDHAIKVWEGKGLQSNASYGKFVLARKRGDVQVSELVQRNGGHRYLFVQKYLTALEAEEFCEKLGGHLVTITSERENEFLKTIAPPDVICCIGMKVSDGVPRWVTGEAVEKNFLPALTDFRPTDKIVAWKNGSWLPSQEDKTMPFIVEWD